MVLYREKLYLRRIGKIHKDNLQNSTENTKPELNGSFRGALELGPITIDVKMRLSRI